MGKKLKIGLAVGAGIIVVGGIASMGNDDSEDKKNSSSSSVQADSRVDSKAEPETESEKVTSTSQADEFKACVIKSGTPTEKTAAKHITKVTGANKQNDVLDSVEVFTDYTGGMMGPHAKDGKLIASAFASCHESRNGLVTVYDKSGEILSNGNF